MATIAELKEERSDLKKKVTIAARRLVGAINRSQTEDMIHQLAKDLEIVYSDFLGVHSDYDEMVNSDSSLSEYATVNGLTCSQYLDTVTEVYESSMSNFKDYFKSIKEAESEKSAKPILIEIEYTSKMMSNTLQEVDNLTSNRDAYAPHCLSKLNMFKGKIDNLISKLREKQDKLYAVQDSMKNKSTFDNVDSLIHQADSSKDFIDGMMVQAESEPPVVDAASQYGSAIYPWSMANMYSSMPPLEDVHSSSTALKPVSSCQVISTSGQPSLVTYPQQQELSYLGHIV